MSIRQPRFADDMWYSSSAKQLEINIQRYLDDVPTNLNRTGELLGIITPHAGYRFSGHVAAAAFAALTPGDFETVVLIGPDHKGAAPGKISTLSAKAWRTPLGDIPVDWDFIKTIQAEIELEILTTDYEHSLEVELPFLQMTLKQFKLVPLMMGIMKPNEYRQLGATLVKAMKNSSKPTLLVASSDLSHFFDDNTARRLDKTTLDFILNLDGDGLFEHVMNGRRQGKPFACGVGAVATLIYATTTMGADKARLLKYATSGDVQPDKSRVVGYAAVAIGKPDLFSK